MGSGLSAVAPRCPSTENAGRTMTVLRHGLCGDDFHQTPVSIIFAKNVQSFLSGFMGDATRVRYFHYGRPWPLRLVSRGVRAFGEGPHYREETKIIRSTLFRAHARTLSGKLLGIGVDSHLVQHQVPVSTRSTRGKIQ